MTASAVRETVIGQLRGLDKESHARSLAAVLARACKPDELPGRVEKANALVAALRERGVTSFYAAEYAKVFNTPEEALSARGRLIAAFEVTNGLAERQAAKMADCIIFTVAKKRNEALIDHVKTLASNALSAGVPFTVVADVVYYNAADVSPEMFAKRCFLTSLKQGKPLSVSETDLTAKLSAALS